MGSPAKEISCTVCVCVWAKYSFNWQIDDIFVKWALQMVEFGFRLSAGWLVGMARQLGFISMNVPTEREKYVCVCVFEELRNSISSVSLSSLISSLQTLNPPSSLSLSVLGQLSACHHVSPNTRRSLTHSPAHQKNNTHFPAPLPAKLLVESNSVHVE